MTVGRPREKRKPMHESAKEYIEAAKKLLDRVDRGTVVMHKKRVPINGDVSKLRWADDLNEAERELLELYRKTTANLAGGQGIRCRFNAVLTGFRVMFGDVLFFTVSPDRRHSALFFRLMRTRGNDTGLLEGFRYRVASPVQGPE